MFLKKRICHQHQSSNLQTLVVPFSLGFAAPLLAAPSPQLVATAGDGVRKLYSPLPT